MDMRVEALVCMTILAVVFKINCNDNVEMSNGAMNKMSSFCYSNEDCPNLKICQHHRCRIPLTIEEIRTAVKIYYSRTREISFEGKPCARHSDCTSMNLLCDMEERVCSDAEKAFNKISRCKDLKKSCRSDADCSCIGQEMKCEAEPSGTESECVLVRSKRTSPAAFFSKTKRKLPVKS